MPKKALYAWRWERCGGNGGRRRDVHEMRAEGPKTNTARLAPTPQIPTARVPSVRARARTSMSISDQATTKLSTFAIAIFSSFGLRTFGGFVSSALVCPATRRIRPLWQEASPW